MILSGRVTCGCCGHNLRHVNGKLGQPYFWCQGLNIYQQDDCVKRIEDFYLEEVILYELQQHIMGLEESDKLLQGEKDKADAELERLKTECRAAENAIEAESKKRMADFEAYALGKRKSYDSSMERMDKLRKRHMELLEQVSLAEEKVRDLSKVKVHENFAVMKLTPELLDEYVENIEVHPGNEVRISWK